MIFAFWLVPKVRSSPARTLAELVGHLFGPRSRKLAALFNFFNVIPITYVIGLGVFIQMLFNQLSLPLCMVIGAAFVVGYSLFGGFRAVVFSDLVQFFVMCSSVLMVALLSVVEFGGWDFLVANLPPTHFHLDGGESPLAFMAWGLIALSTLVDPNFYQRSMAARSTSTAKKGIVISTVVWMIFDLCTTFGAMYAKTQIPLAEPNQSYLLYSVQLLPSGLRGFFLAGVLATLLSTIDSYLFVASSSLGYDLMPQKGRDSVWFHRLAYPVGVVFSACLAVGLGLFFEGNIKAVWKTLGSYSAACLLLPVLVGFIFPRRLSDKQFLSTCFFSLAGTTWWSFEDSLLRAALPFLEELYVGSLLSLVAIAFFFYYNNLNSPKEKGHQESA